MNTNSCFNIPVYQSFCNSIAKEVLKSVKNVEELSDHIIIVQSNKVIKSLQLAFLQESNATALILPQIVSIDNINSLFFNIDLNSLSEEELFLYKEINKPTFSINARALVLTNLIKIKEPHLSTASVYKMALYLGSLIDRFHNENIDFENKSEDLLALVSSHFSDYWIETVEFLKIITEAWPNICKEQQKIDKSLQQKYLYQLHTSLLNKKTLNKKISIANVTSFSNNVIDLCKKLIETQNAKIYFYGLDKNILNEKYENISYKHPQKSLYYTIKGLNLPFTAITNIYEDASLKSKEDFCYSIFNSNPKPLSINKESLNKYLSIITTKNEHDEAKTIGVIVKKYLENKEKTTCIICNNTYLASQIKNSLLRWDIQVNDFLGDPLIDYPNTNFMFLVINSIKENLSPYSLLSVVKHPIFNLGYEKSKLINFINILDLEVMRNPIFKETETSNGIENILYTLKLTKENSLFKRNQKSLENTIVAHNESYDSFIKFIEKLYDTYKNNFLSKINKSKSSLKNLLMCHIKLSEELSLSEQTSVLWKSQEGKELSYLLSSLLEDAHHSNPISIVSYYDILEVNIKPNKVIQVHNKHPRVFLCGSLQSNLLSFDNIIIASLNEGMAPYVNSPNPWFNKAMIENIGLVPEESYIGLQSYIMLQCLGAENVTLIRSEKDLGVATVPSRWIEKIEALLQKNNLLESLNENQEVIKLKDYIDYPDSIHKPLQLEYVTVEPKFLPGKVSFSDYNKLSKNPYEFFIQKVLGIYEINPIDTRINSALIGNYTHYVLETFYNETDNYNNKKLDEKIDTINNIAYNSTMFLQSNASFLLFHYKPKILSFAQGTVSLLHNEDKILSKVVNEASACLTINLSNGRTVNFSIRADHIRMNDKTEGFIIDYKTGSSFKVSETQQLEIAALLLKYQRFESFNANHISTIKLQYIVPNSNKEYLVDITSPEGFKEGVSLNDENFKQIDDEISNTLEHYFVNRRVFEFNYNKSRSSSHFARYEEWSENIDDLISSEKDEENE